MAREHQDQSSHCAGLSSTSTSDDKIQGLLRDDERQSEQKPPGALLTSNRESKASSSSSTPSASVVPAQRKYYKMGVCCGPWGAASGSKSPKKQQAPLEAESKMQEDTNASGPVSSSENPPSRAKPARGLTGSLTEVSAVSQNEKILLSIDTEDDMRTVRSDFSEARPVLSMTLSRQMSWSSQSPGRAFPPGAEIPWFSVFDSLPKELNMETSATRFKVRNVGYKQSGEKIFSKPALYDLIGGDVVQAKNGRIHEIVSNWDCKFPRKAGYKEEWGIPEILVEHGEVPFKSGGLFSSHPVDDLGFNLVGYFILSDEAIRLLSTGTWTPQLRLWKRIVDQGRSEKKGLALKKIVQVRNVAEMNVPNLFKSYNGKPVLLSYSARFNRVHAPRILEIDYDVRTWGYALRTAIPTVLGKLPAAQTEYALLVEGKDDDELPEQILCCGGYNNLEITKVPFAEPLEVDDS
ncbi:unnamed protein product [Amoebophrya sp. A120]|nr:unnamed protein product [Amoebophrya sp. A120]|eukprot:GSA120T00020217001.1